MGKLTLPEITEVVTHIAPSYPVISIDLFGSYAENVENDLSMLRMWKTICLILIYLFILIYGLLPYLI